MALGSILQSDTVDVENIVTQLFQQDFIFRKRFKRKFKKLQYSEESLLLNISTTKPPMCEIVHESGLFENPAMAYDVGDVSYCSQYQYPQIYNYCSIGDNEYDAVIATHISAAYTPMVAHVVPIVAPPIVTCINMCQYNTIIGVEPMVSPVTPHIEAGVVPAICECEEMYELENNIKESPNFLQNYEMTLPQSFTGVMNSPNVNIEPSILENNNSKQNFEFQNTNEVIEFYFSLPKELFPTPRMFTIDPNPIIDEFCKMENATINTSWLLDLEFGVPKAPVTRAIAVYDVKLNSIHCKNTPDAIHPGFENCGPDFKRVILFYYDCIVSSWYKGYMTLNQDKSVENFQSWLFVPMQVFGMAWR